MVWMSYICAIPFVSLFNLVCVGVNQLVSNVSLSVGWEVISVNGSSIVMTILLDLIRYFF